MTKITYKYSDNVCLSEHFSSYEWRCKCGNQHDLIIDDEIVPILEKLMKKIGSNYATIVSGYRCPAHEKEVGGNGGDDYSHSGYAVDIDFYDKKGGKLFSSKQVVLALEDLGWNYGIGYKCGGNSNRTHIDSKHRKWYGDESKSMTASIGDSFYTYFGEPKTVQLLNKTLTHNVYGRNGIGFKYKKTLYKKGTVVSNCKMNVGKSNGYSWFSGYIGNMKVYFPYDANWYK